VHEDLLLSHEESERQRTALAALNGYLAAVQAFRQAKPSTPESSLSRQPSRTVASGGAR
jgi:hypothetical protein